VGFDGRRGADASARVAGPSDVAGVRGRGAGHRVAAEADAGLAGIALGARVPVAAGGAVRERRAAAHARLAGRARRTGAPAGRPVGLGRVHATLRRARPSEVARIRGRTDGAAHTPEAAAARVTDRARVAVLAGSAGGLLAPAEAVHPRVAERG